ncbi:MAG: ATP-binding protein [Acholeplasmatales bacterium]|nr:ATP-binding protein [Acholeplasmatales bacterium]
MLKKVRFKNFKSFTKETIISFDSSKSMILQDTNVYNDILKGCCFYGSNASGKTSALLSITLLLDLLFIDTTVNPTLFTLYNNEKTMYFEYTFEINNSEIVYYFEFNRNNQITKETLAVNGENKLFRTLNSAESKITENKDYGKNDIDENNLFLKNIYFNTKFTNYTDLRDWFNFLKNSLYYNPLRQIGKIVLFDKARINDYELILYLEKNGADEINNFFEEFDFPYKIKYEKKNGLLQNPFLNIIFVREELADIPFPLESNGNQVLLNILPSFLSVVKNGGIFAIDEFSSGLHNNLEALLVKYFFKHSKNAQLIFVSHSTNLLSTNLLRPDQIYSVDFDKNGSFLKKFSDEKPRESQNLEKMYLAGIFGGIPQYEDKQM